MNIELMERKLYDACLKGDVEMLEALMREDELTLARISLSSCFNQTPLHLACMLGHFEFVKSLLSYKPDFARRLDSQGRSPLHLAAANGYANIVELLLQHDQKMCQIGDEDGRTPFHLAVMNGQHESVSELLKVNSESCNQELGAALHLCVMYNRLNVLILILNSTDQDLSNSKDDKGNTVLHSATTLRRQQIIKYLVLSRSDVLNVNAVNENGLTALDIIEQMPKDVKTMEIKEVLVSAGTWRAKETSRATRTVSEEQATAVAAEEEEAVPDYKCSNWVKTSKKTLSIFQKKEEKVDKTLLVAASVIAAMAYQAAISPPGGVVGFDAQYYDPKAPHPRYRTYALYPATSLLALFHRNDSARFWIANTISYLASLSVIFLYVNGVGLKRKIFIWLIRLAMWITLTSMTVAYIFAVEGVTGVIYSPNPTIRIGLFSWAGLISLSVLVVFYRFLRYAVGPFIIQIIKRATKKNNTSEEAVVARIPNTINMDESITCTSKKIEIIDE